MKNVFYTILVSATILLSACQKPADACFTYTPTSITTSTIVTFNAACTQNASTYSWNFGENKTDTMVNIMTVTHQFVSAGQYTVKLIAERKDGVTLRKGEPIITQVINVK